MELVLWPAMMAWTPPKRKPPGPVGASGRGAGWGRGAWWLLGGHVERVDAVGRGVDHGLQVRRVAVDVEVEGAGVGLVGEPPDAVAGVLVDPGFGWNFGVGGGGLRGEGGGEGRDAEEGG